MGTREYPAGKELPSARKTDFSPVAGRWLPAALRRGQASEVQSSPQLWLRGVAPWSNSCAGLPVRLAAVEPSRRAAAGLTKLIRPWRAKAQMPAPTGSKRFFNDLGGGG